MKLGEIIEKINAYYPSVLAYEWDNPGLALGDKERSINKIMLTLDVTEQVLHDAEREGADLVVSHHPLIFGGVKSITTDTHIGRMLLFAAERKIALFSAHTNMDTAEDGINARLARLFGFKDSVIIEPNGETTGLGRIGSIDEMCLLEFCEIVKKTLNTPFVRVSGCKNQLIKKVAIGSGSCAELIPRAIEMGADTIVTADLKYHTCLDYASDKFSIIDAGHFPTENIVKEMFAEILKGENIVFSSQRDVFEVI